MSTIAMPTTIQCAINSMTIDAVSQALNLLAVKYNFDPEEARRHINLDHLEINAVTTLTKGTKTATGPKTKTKRGTNGYIIFSKEKRPEITANLLKELDAGEKLKSSKVITALASAWKVLSLDEQTTWNNKAKIANDVQLKTREDSDQDSCKLSSDDDSSEIADSSEKPDSSEISEISEIAEKPDSKKPKGTDSKKPKGTDSKKPKGTDSEKPKGTDSKKPKGTDSKKHSGYLLFARSIKPSVIASLQELTGHKPKPDAVLGEVAIRWKTLSESQKAKWDSTINCDTESD